MFVFAHTQLLSLVATNLWDMIQTIAQPCCVGHILFAWIWLRGFPKGFWFKTPTAYLYAPIIHDLVKLQHTVAECNIQWFPYNKHTIEIIFYHKYMGEEKIYSKASLNLEPPLRFGKKNTSQPSTTGSSECHSHTAGEQAPYIGKSMEEWRKGSPHWYTIFSDELKSRLLLHCKSYYDRFFKSSLWNQLNPRYDFFQVIIPTLPGIPTSIGPTSQQKSSPLVQWLPSRMGNTRQQWS